MSARKAPAPIRGPRATARAARADRDRRRLVLGRLNGERFLGGNMELDRARAERQWEICRTLGLEACEAALGITTHRRRRHVACGARGLGQSRHRSARHDLDRVRRRRAAARRADRAGDFRAAVVIPKLPGKFSALGMLMAEWRHDFVRTLIGGLGTFSRRREAAFAELRGAGQESIARDNPGGQVRVRCRSALSRAGAHHSDTGHATPGLDDATDDTRARFDRQHDLQYGHAAPDQSIEVVNLRLVVTLPRMTSHRPLAVGAMDARGRHAGAAPARRVR